MSVAVNVLSLPRQSRSIARFLRVPYGIYRSDPHWVAPLLMDLAKVFTDANPLFEHAEMQLWVAERDGRDVGRVAGIVDRQFNTTQGERTAFFGFFEAENDQIGRAHV